LLPNFFRSKRYDQPVQLLNHHRHSLAVCVHGDDPVSSQDLKDKVVVVGSGDEPMKGPADRAWR
jgi:aromatic ring-cleaving dioxygenase